MSHTSPLVLPPYKGSTVRVSALQGGRVALPAKFLVEPSILGQDILDVPAFCFLVENDQAGKKIMFDLGLMKAWETKLGPKLLGQREAMQATIDVPFDVSEILTSASVDLSSINAIIWSHHHLDHTGDPSLFPSTTSLVVGPNFKSNPDAYPGYPTNPNAITVQSAFDGREVIELDFSDAELTVGGLRAIDWFQDGSFYLLEALGHTNNHIVALARTSVDKFLLLGADAAHHCGEFRPTPLIPLPESITPSPLEHPRSSSVCPGAIFEPIHRSASLGAARTTPFYEPAAIGTTDLVKCKETIEVLKVFDASPDVLVIVGHDYTILDLLELYPKGELTGWEKRGAPGIKEGLRWRFLRDFKKAVEANQGAK